MNDDAAAVAQPLSRKTTRKILDRFRVTSGNGFRLKDYSTDDPMPDLVDKAQAAAMLQQGVQRLSELQERLYAGNTWSLLIVLQAMDAAGKDSTIKHVMSGVNPQGVHVTSFKAPGPEDLSHDFLWRITRALPADGMIGIFNRSHYEEVLVTRVHPQLLERQHLPVGPDKNPKFWENRLQDIAAFERHLSREGTKIVKFYLNLSRAEQKKRFLARLDEPDKNWKFSSADIVERGFWKQYRDAYEEAIAATATEDAPWFVVPADQKWFTRLVVVAAINEALESLDLAVPRLSAEEQARLAAARKTLEESD